MRLTDLAVRALKPPETGVKIYSDDQLTGFGIRITQAGTASYVLTLPGPTRDRVTLGRVGNLSLKDARSIARERLAEITLGKHRPKRMTFVEAIDIFVAEKEQKNRASTIRENERILRRYFGPLHRRQLSEITTHEITRILDKLRTTPGTALHSFWTLRTFLRWCEGRRLINDSPLRGVEAPAAVVNRTRLLSDDEFKAIVHAARDSRVFGKIVLLLAFTGQRRIEISSLEREWIDGGQRTIRLPDWLCKNRREHVFPYADLVGDILATLPREELLFPAESGKPWSNFSKTKDALDEKCGVEDWVLHDLRRHYATTLQRLGVRREVTEALLNHVSGSRGGIVAVYQRHDWMPEMIEATRLYNDHMLRLLNAPV